LRSRTAATALAAALLLALPASGQPRAPGADGRRPFIYRMETLRTPAALPESVVRTISPMRDLAQIEAVLKANDVTYAWQRGEVSTTVMTPQLVQQLEGVPPGEVFARPEPNGGVVIGVILSRRMAGTP